MISYESLKENRAVTKVHKMMNQKSEELFIEETTKKTNHLLL